MSASAQTGVDMTWLLEPSHPDVISPKQLMTIRGTLTVIRVKQTTNDNSL